MAGIWEHRKDEGEVEVQSCALMTTPASGVLAEVHNEKLRMSTVLRKEDHEVWRAGRAGGAMQALRPYPSEAIEAWQVGRRLYANKTPDNASLIEPVAR